jgi:hypothetical protein
MSYRRVGEKTPIDRCARLYQNVRGQFLGDMVIVYWIVDLVCLGYFISGVGVKCFTFGMAGVLRDMKLWFVLGIKNT